MAELNLDEIQARADAATPGPWVVDRSGGIDDPEYCTESGCRGYHVWPADDAEEYIERAMTYTPDDAIFVAHAREDVPALIARVRELEGLLAEERRENAAFNEEVAGLWSLLEAARAEADRLGDRIAELERKNRELWARLDAAREHAGHADHSATVLEAERDDARAEADRLGDRCELLEGLLDEALREPHPEAGELRHRIRQALA